MRIRCIQSAQSGTTLTEVVIATGIIGIMAAGIITSFNYGFLTMGRVRENQRATQIMLEKAETIRLYSWTQINTSGFIPSTFYDTYDPQASQGDQGITYTGSLAIASVPFTNSYSTNLREFTVTLQWTGAGGISRTRSLTTIVAQDGMQNYVY